MEAHRDRETCANVVVEEEEDDDDNNVDESADKDVLKRRISTHPLFGELVRIHLDCLKVGVVGEARGDHYRMRNQQHIIEYNKSSRRMLHHSDLDQFMEAYCVALSKLRDAMEEPQHESMAFISSMHSQLQEMTGVPIAHSDTPPPLPPRPTSSG
ncbi:homeobox protein knotted-1-like 1 [Punica granatum]|uniref:Uncharacterized protein n=2 Tax=Punica granatum TaxID=22663 RepID=A0A218XES8_PUNGR|nr:homeobox protein knotted-1-like 1 [Punica granatum]OWM82981.1 hypothetical protein CDL15_Pgr005381 [Punica granatum]PKI71712.1 hypothetical protein CRG98_007845 [Punica granatum]